MRDSASAGKLPACSCATSSGHLVCCPVAERAAILVTHARMSEADADERANRTERTGQRALFL